VLDRAPGRGAVRDELLPAVLRVDRRAVGFALRPAVGWGGLELGANLFLFGGVATVVVVALVGLIRGERQPGRGFLAGAVSAWSLTWIGSLLQSASLREATIPRGLSLDAGFWLQALSICVAVIGTILVGFGKRSEVKDSHDRYANEEGVDTGV